MSFSVIINISPPEWVAWDMCAQAEHDEMAQSIFLSDDLSYIAEVKEALAKIVPTLERRSIVEKSLVNRGAIIHYRSDDEAIAFINQLAPEHLELLSEDSQAWLDDIYNAGAIFLGRWSSEAFGDYIAGPNHVLPTSGAAKYASPLSVHDFQKKQSIIQCSKEGSDALSPVIAELASIEGLSSHANSALIRQS